MTVNVVGGYDFRGDPSSDLPLAVAVTSSLYDRPVGHEVACVGGVGLAGEIRAVPALARRIGEWDGGGGVGAGVWVGGCDVIVVGLQLFGCVTTG